MSGTPKVSAGVPEAPSIPQRTCYYRCIACGQRFWQKKSLVRRAARCKGNVMSPESMKIQPCKAWRCRYNDQCPEADAECTICGATKPPEFLLSSPASVSSPASLAYPASSSNPVPDRVSQLPASSVSGNISRTLYGHSLSGAQWMAHLENASQEPGGNASSDPHMIPPYFPVCSDTYQSPPAPVPNLGTVIERYLTEV